MGSLLAKEYWESVAVWADPEEERSKFSLEYVEASKGIQVDVEEVTRSRVSTKFSISKRPRPYSWRWLQYALSLFDSARSPYFVTEKFPLPWNPPLCMVQHSRHSVAAAIEAECTATRGTFASGASEL